MRAFIVALAASSAFLAAAQPAKWDRDHPMGGFDCPAFRIQADAPHCNATQFTYRILYEKNATSEVVLESGGLLTKEYAHDVHLCAGNYSVLISNHGADASCAPAWSLVDENNTLFFSSESTYVQGSQAYFSIDEQSCFNLTKYGNDFEFQNASEANSTCYNSTVIPPAPVCPGVVISAEAPACAAFNFTYRLLKGAEETVVESANLQKMNHVFRICDHDNYTVLLSNHGADAKCSPPTWSLANENGTVFFSSSDSFAQASQASFEIDSNNCYNLTTYGTDFQLLNATSDNSTCASSAVVVPTVAPTDAPTDTPVPTGQVQPDGPVADQTDSSANHFWLHTFWGIFLIVLFCLLALLVLGYLIFTCCIKDKKAAEGTDAERKPILQNKSHAEA